MRKTLFTILSSLIFVALFERITLARDAARDLRKLVGYTIIMADAVNKVFEGKDGDKFIKLSNGWIFKVEFLLLDPLPITDVIVFAKPFPKDLIESYKGKLPERMLYSCKLLIDNEVHDANTTVKEHQITLERKRGQYGFTQIETFNIRLSRGEHGA